MIKLIDKDTLKHIKKCYQTFKPDDFIDMDDTIFSQLSSALIKQAYVIHNDEFTGFIIVYPYDNNIALNPWFLNGYPIGEEPELLLKEAMDFFKESDYTRIEIIGDKDFLNVKKLPLKHVYDYSDLTKILFQEALVEADFVSFEEDDEKILKEIYHKSFLQSDALFYEYQSENERLTYWKHLSFDKAVLDPCSIAIKEDNRIIGFVLAYRDGRKNRHISCMCVLPEYNNKGYGTMLLKQVFHLASLAGDETISLGTETTMKAYELYIKNGFSVKQTKSYYLQKG